MLNTTKKYLHQILTVNEIVFKRTGKGDSMGKCCGKQLEVIEHMLFFYIKAQMVWKMAPIQYDKLN